MRPVAAMFSMWRSRRGEYTGRRSASLRATSAGALFVALWMLGIVGLGPPEVSYENIRFREGTVVFDFVKAIDEAAGVFAPTGQKPVAPAIRSIKRRSMNSSTNMLGKLKTNGLGSIHFRRALTDEIQGTTSRSIQHYCTDKIQPARPRSRLDPTLARAEKADQLRQQTEDGDAVRVCPRKLFRSRLPE